MKLLRWPFGRSLGAGLGLGVALGLFEVLTIRAFDMSEPPLGLVLRVMAGYGGLGALGGLAWGLGQSWRARRAGRAEGELAPPRPVAAAERLAEGRWPRVRRIVGQGVGAGLVAGVAVGVVEVLLLMGMEATWQHVEGLLYAVIAYGALGLLGGLALGLLWGPVCSFSSKVWGSGRILNPSPDEGQRWGAFVALLVWLGTFLVVRHRIREHLTTTQLWHILLLDGILLLVTGVSAGLVPWLGLRRLLRGRRAPRIAQLRWSLTAYAAALAAAALLSALPALARPPAPGAPASIPGGLLDAPNVILIVADALRADYVSCYARYPAVGGAENHTPHLDALAGDGVRYRDMSAQSSWTRPAVATILTSLYPTSHRAIDYEDLLPDGVITLPEVLQARGYRTAGLTTNVNIAPQFNFGQGFDEYTYLEPDLPFFTSRVSRRFAVVAVLYRLRWELYHVYHFPNERYRDAATLNREALAWLEANRQSRFFLFLHYMDPHTPYYAHPYDNRNVIGEEYLEAPDPAQRVAPARQLYGGEVAYLDSYLGELFDQLKAWGLYDDALIVFTGDHGEEFYEHQGWTHGKTLYEEQLRVPLIVKLPGQASANAVAWAPARGLDLAPTVLDVAGIPVPQTMQGVSLWPGAAQPRAEILFAELSFRANTIRSIRQGPRKLIVAQEGNPHSRGLPPLALFDLQADPSEQTNLAQSEPGEMQALRTALDQVMSLAASQAVAPHTGKLDAATRERLRQLGY